MLEGENIAGTPVPDAPADSSPAPTTTTDAPAAPSPANTDLDWGMSPEDLGAPAADEQPGNTAQPTATDPPAPREGEQEGEKAPDQPEAPTERPADGDQQPQTDEQAGDGKFAFNDKLNWADDKVPFRREFEALKEAYLASEGVQLTQQLVTEPDRFADWIKETSPTAYNEIGAKLATESATQHPDKWADFLAQNHPDLLAEKVSGREGMTMDRLKAELAVLLDEDDPDVQRKLDEQKAGKADEPAKPAQETEEQKLIREIKEEREAKAREEASNVVLQPIEREVNALVSQAGLDVELERYAGQDLTKLDEDTAFRVLVNQLLPVYIGMKADSDPKMKAMQARMEQLVDAKDVNGLRNIQHPAQIFATNAAAEFLAIVTGQRARAKQKDTTPPSPETPKPQVRTAGAAPAAFTASERFAPGKPIDWSGDMSK